jgi:hypothetical protein
MLTNREDGMFKIKLHYEAYQAGSGLQFLADGVMRLPFPPTAGLAISLHPTGDADADYEFIVRTVTWNVPTETFHCDCEPVEFDARSSVIRDAEIMEKIGLTVDRFW